MDPAGTVFVAFIVVILLIAYQASPPAKQLVMTQLKRINNHLKQEDYVLVVGLILFVLAGLFPPWTARYHTASIVASPGYSWLFWRPDPPKSDFYDGPEDRYLWKVTIDTNRLYVQWILIVVVTGVVYFIVRNRLQPPQAPPLPPECSPPQTNAESHPQMDTPREPVIAPPIIGERRAELKDPVIVEDTEDSRNTSLMLGSAIMGLPLMVFWILIPIFGWSIELGRVCRNVWGSGVIITFMVVLSNFGDAKRLCRKCKNIITRKETEKADIEILFVVIGTIGFIIGLLIFVVIPVVSLLIVTRTHGLW